MIPDTLGEAVRYLRTEAGLSQTELAALVDMSQPNLSRIEAGAQSTTLSTIRRLEELLKVERGTLASRAVAEAA